MEEQGSYQEYHARMIKIAADVSGRIVGMGIAEARLEAENAGIVLRITNRDGSPLIITRDMRPDRVNVRLDNNIVTTVDIG